MGGKAGFSSEIQDREHIRCGTPQPQHMPQIGGLRRAYTFVDPKRVWSSNAGYCFIAAGWKVIGKTKSGKRILEKQLT